MPFATSIKRGESNDSSYSKIDSQSLVHKWAYYSQYRPIGLPPFSVERIRQGAKEGFTNAITSTDLIIGAKGSPINLLLYSIFHIGTPMENISWESYETIRDRQDIEWTIPISLGDSLDIFRVVGTNDNFFKHYQYADYQRLKMSQGEWSLKIDQLVLGADAADALGYKVGDEVYLSHGAQAGTSFHNHDDHPFKVSGVLDVTGTPVDKSVFVSLEGMDKIHEGWEDGAPPAAAGFGGLGSTPESDKKDEHAHEEEHQHSDATPQDEVTANDYSPKEITAFLLKTKSRIGALPLQRWINDYEKEPLIAAIPGLVLADLWQGLSYVEASLGAIAILVVIVGLLSMLIAIYNTLNERKREIAIFRSLGASPSFVFVNLVSEAVIISAAGILSGFVLSRLLLYTAANYLRGEFSVSLEGGFVSATELSYGLMILGFSFILGIIPAFRAYRNTVNDGLTIRS